MVTADATIGIMRPAIRQWRRISGKRGDYELQILNSYLDQICVNWQAGNVHKPITPCANPIWRSHERQSCGAICATSRRNADDIVTY